MLREVAIMLKQKGVNIEDFAQSIRLHNYLHRMGLTEEQLESLIEKIRTHCYMYGQSEPTFISKIEAVTDLANNLGMSVYDIPQHIIEKKRKIEFLEQHIEELDDKVKQKIKEYNITKKDLEGYRLSIPFAHKIDKLQRIIKEQDAKIFLLKEELQEYKMKYSEY